MRIALNLAQKGLGRTSPNPAVGAVIVRSRSRRGAGQPRVIGRGYHKRAGMPHAEVAAIRDAVRRGHSTRGSTMYVNLEPCGHYGRTPPCTDAVIKAGIREVVVGMRDPDRQVSGRGIGILKKNKIWVRVGVLAGAGRELNEAYIKHRRTGLPFVILKIATTLDGRIGPGQVTSKKSQSEAHLRYRDKVDAILVGRGTIQKDNPRLTTRLKNGRGRDPIRVVLDSRLSLSPRARVFHVRSEAQAIVATTLSEEDPRYRRKVSRFPKKVEFLHCRRARRGAVNLRDLLDKLGKRGILSVLVEGGPTVWGSFLKAHLVDKVVRFIGPSVHLKSILKSYS